MDTTWMYGDRTSPQFRDGVEFFLESIYLDVGPNGCKKCPCAKCYGRFYSTRDNVRDDLIVNGFMENYLPWSFQHNFDISSLGDGGQNEDLLSNYDVGDDIVGMIHDAMGIPTEIPTVRDSLNEEGQTFDANTETMDDETTKIFKMLEEGHRPLFRGSKKFTSLSFITRLLHIKVLGGWSNKSCTMALELFHEVLEEIGDVALSKSYYEANKIVSDLGFTYETWDACPNDCMLFRGDEKSLENCDICGASRYKQFGNDEQNVEDIVIKRKQIAAKQVRYFPLKPRLKRLFMSPHTASLMTWHSKERVDDGVMRHPADSPTWKTFDKLYPDFASESRNVRLAVASDGFNPFRSMNISHSTWPVVLIPYNLPPWLCMKQPSFILSVLIDGPKAPGDKIDVYLQPLIEEMKELWYDGVNTYDASTKSMFKLHASLMWTINDFPAYANLSGWSTKGKFACPCCNKKTRSFRLKHSRKFCYLGHRRWLKESHKLRRDRAAFHGEPELEPKPKLLSGSELLEQLKDVETIYRKEDVLGKRKREQLEKEKEKERKAAIRREKRKEIEIGNQKGRMKGKGKGKETNGRKGKTKESENAGNGKEDSWKKKSIFFELPYWESLPIRHMLDVMHIEKNVCDNVLHTLLGTLGKTKDHLNARLDLKEMKIREPLHPKDNGSGKKLLPPACFTLGKDEKDMFLKLLKDVKVPDGYASNIARCVNLKERSIWGLKSHDSHIILQQLLPLAVRKILPKHVVEALIELSNFFRILCSKVNSKSDLEYLQDRIALTLCHLEKIFPPSFFDIMEHLPIHLAEEALLAGPVQYRWMYPIERYLLTLKLYVRNRARPEASIAKGALMEECMTFCARYLKDIETKSTRPDRNDSGEDNVGRHFGQEKPFFLDHISMEQANHYLLATSDAIKPYRERHLLFLQKSAPRAPIHERQRLHIKEFPSWFKSEVLKEASAKVPLENEIKDMALGLTNMAKRYNGYIINGFRFRTKRTDSSRVTQNSGVVLSADTTSYSSRKDKNPVSGDQTFYGELTDIIEVRYTSETKFVLFKCNWVDNRTGVEVDNYGITSVNFNHLLYKENKVTDEPFILASQAQQVMYIEDPIDPQWKAAIKMTSRDTFDMGVDENSNSTLAVPQVQPYNPQQLDERRTTDDGDLVWVRNGVEGTLVEGRVSRPRVEENDQREKDFIDSSESDDESHENVIEVDAIDDFEEEEFDDMDEESDDMNDDLYLSMSDDESDD